MDEIRNSALELRLVVAGMHLQPEFGQTEAEIAADGFDIDARVPMAAADDEASSMVAAIAMGVSGFGRAFDQTDPDVVLVLGDRVEAFAASIAGAGSNRLVAHLHGGEVTRGGLDESMRHAITKLSHLHFAATKRSRQRIIQMGEDPNRVFCVGAPGLDAARRLARLSTQELERRIGVPLRRPLVVVVQHPVTTRADEAAEEIRETLEALAATGHQAICLYPNSDAGGRRMIGVIDSFGDQPWLRVVANLEHAAYLSLLAKADVLVGNTSSGIIEAPFFHLPVVNIGERQAGRERGDNVLDVPPQRDAIGRAVAEAIGDTAFRRRARQSKTPYGDGRAAERVVEILRRTRNGPELLQKHFVD
jgi:GDP/UDP-N,N'-diacetylbacillosamine 2-epimerase (hydrolysing)